MTKAPFYRVLILVVMLVGCARKTVNSVSSRLYDPDRCYSEHWYSERKAHEMYKTHLRCFGEMVGYNIIHFVSRRTG